MDKWSAECFFPASHRLGEGPLWREEDQTLFWVDILDHKLHSVSVEDGNPAEWVFPQGISSLCLSDFGNFIATSADGFLILNSTMSITRVIGPVEQDPVNYRFNDAKVDPRGRLWAGTMHRDLAEPGGALFRLDADLSWSRQDAGYFVCNGPTFSLDGKSLFHTDSKRQAIYRFDLAENGSIANKRLFARLGEEEGNPDGMTTDSEGCIWVASYHGWRVTRFSPDGDRIGRVEVPVPNVTSCAFGGPDYRTLYITTARSGLRSEQIREYPMSGSVFHVETGIRGLAPDRFRLGGRDRLLK